jgi:hypothetical protein
MKKTILRLLIALLYSPILILTGVLAILKTLFKLIFVFTWEVSSEWSDELLGKVDEFVKTLKTKEQQ